MNIIMFLSRLLVLVIGGIKGDAYFTISLFGITGAMLWIFNCFYIQHLAGISVSRVLKTIFRETLYALPYTVIPILTFVATHNSLIFVLSGIGAGAVFLMVQLSRLRETGL